MKKSPFSMLFILVIAIYLISCKDDPEPSLPGEMVLSKVSREGKLELEYRYNANKQLEQIREYDISTGLLDYYSEFQYDIRGFLQNEITYNANGTPASNRKYVKNNSGQFLSSELMVLMGPDSGKVVSRQKYEYNKEGYISKGSWHDPETDAEESYQLYYYYPNGNLEHSEYYWTLIPTPEKTVEIRYSPAGELLPENISKHRGYPINFDLYLFVSEEIKYEIFDSGLTSASEYYELISDRIYNSQGLITEQTITNRYVVPEQPDEVVRMKYEYTGI